MGNNKKNSIINCLYFIILYIIRYINSLEIFCKILAYTKILIVTCYLLLTVIILLAERDSDLGYSYLK